MIAPNTGKGLEQLEFLYVVSGNVNGANSLENLSGSFLSNQTHTYPLK